MHKSKNDLYKLVDDIISKEDFEDMDQEKSVFKLIDEKRILAQILRRQITQKARDQVSVNIA